MRREDRSNRAIEELMTALNQRRTNCSPTTQPVVLPRRVRQAQCRETAENPAKIVHRKVSRGSAVADGQTANWSSARSVHPTVPREDADKVSLPPCLVSARR